MVSKIIVSLCLLLAAVLLISTQVAARDLPQTTSDASTTGAVKTDTSVGENAYGGRGHGAGHRPNYGSGRHGSTSGGGHYGRGGGHNGGRPKCKHGCENAKAPVPTLPLF